MFWLRKCNINDRQFEGIEKDLQQYAFRVHEKLSGGQRAKPIECKDRVAVYFVDWKKWIRCDVDVIDAIRERCILWSIDYGFPFQSSINMVVLIEDNGLAQQYTNLITRAAIHMTVPSKNVS